MRAADPIALRMRLLFLSVGLTFRRSWWARWRGFSSIVRSRSRRTRARKTSMRLLGVSVVVGTAVLSLAWNLSSGRTHPKHPAGPDEAAITASIDSSERSSDDRSRDEWAKPKAVLTFLGAR